MHFEYGVLFEKITNLFQSHGLDPEKSASIARILTEGELLGTLLMVCLG